jgi:dissimilatory sulfite reductase (desulfoviridin) alpha/beta subunit
MAALKVTPEQEKEVKALGFLRNRGTDNFNGRIITVNGKITAAQQKCIAEAAEKYGNGNVLFTTRLTVEILGIPYDKIEEFRAYIAREGLETGGTGSKVRPVVSCKATTCKYGLINGYALSEKIHRDFMKVTEMSGCPINLRSAWEDARTTVSSLI